MYFYTLYDLCISSELRLPDIPEQKKPLDEEKSCTIRFGKISPDGLADPLEVTFAFQRNNHEFWLNIPSLARFLISNGETIIIEPLNSIDESSLVAFVFSIAMEMLLKQRKLCVFPGFAIKLGNSAIAFTGPPGQGYAMLQGAFFKKGYAFVATQLLALNQGAEILPGIAHLEFWPEVASGLGFNVNLLKTVRPAIEKSILPLGRQFFSQKLPLQGMLVLKQRKEGETKFFPLKNSEKIQYLQQAVKHHPAAAFFGEGEYHAMLENMEIMVMEVPAKGMQLQQLINTLENHLLKWTGINVEC